MLEKDPQKRPSPSELLSHKLFGGMDLKDSATQNTEHGSNPIIQINKSIEPKKLTELKNLGVTSPKVK